MKNTLKILVANNDPEIIIHDGQLFRAGGYTITVVGSAHEALNRIKRDSYDLILTDAALCDRSGRNLAEWIKHFRPASQSVVLTGSQLQKSIKDALKLCVNDLMSTPMITRVLKDTIERYSEWLADFTARDEPEEEFPSSLYEELDRAIHRSAKKPAGIIPVLLTAQEIFGYLPQGIQDRVARGLNMRPTEVRSIVSFHSCFRSDPEQNRAEKYSTAKPWEMYNLINGHLKTSAPHR